MSKKFLFVCARHFFQKSIQTVRTTRVVCRMARRFRIVISKVKKVIRRVINPRIVTIPRTVTIRSQDLLSLLEYCR